MKRILLILAALAFTVPTALAQQMQPLPFDPEIRVGQLDNGLTYYIRHNDLPAERAEFYLATRVGAIQETPEQDGLAHFLEHMCFNGTENLPDKTLLEYLQSIGAEFGANINASTGVEFTEYMLNNIPVIREGIVDTCLLIMHDYSHYVTNDPVEVDKERGVILEEKRSRNDAAWRMYDQSRRYLYKGSKYADCSIIGSDENLTSFDPKHLVEFYRTWYRPEMQAVIVVGDIDVDAVEAKIQAIFSEIPNPENPQPKEMYQIPDNDSPIIGILTDPENTTTSIEIYWKTEPLPWEMKNTAVNYLNDLSQTLVYYIMRERLGDIAAQTSAPFLRAAVGMGALTQTCDAVYATVTTKEGKDEVIEGFNTIIYELRKMEEFGFTDDEFNRAKEEILSQLEKDAEAKDTRKNSEFIGPITRNFFQNEYFMDPETEYALAQQMLSSVLNPQVLNQMVEKLIPENNMIILYKGIEKEGATHPYPSELIAALVEAEKKEIVPNDEVAYSEPLLDPETLAGGTIDREEEGVCGSTEWTLSNGAKVVVLPTRHKKDPVIIQLRKEGGRTLIADEDLPSFEQNIMGSLERGFGLSKFPKTTLSKMLSGKQVGVGFSLGNINHSINANCSPKDLETAFQMLYLKFADPRFAADEYTVAMNSLEAILPNILSTPQSRMTRELYGTIYGEDNPRNVNLSEDILEKISLETYERVYRSVLFNDVAGAIIYIVGNTDLETLRPLVEKYIGSLPSGAEQSAWIAENALRVIPGLKENVFTTAMESPKSTVYHAWTADTPYSIEREVAFSAVEYILSMIYTDTLREDEGGTYGAGVGCSLIREPHEFATLQVSFDTKPESADKLRKMAADEFRELAEDGPSEEYFARTIENFRKNIPESRISNNYWLTVLRRYEMYGERYDEAYEAAVEALTPADVQAAAQTIASSGNFIEVVMKPEAGEETEAAEEPETLEEAA